MSYTAEISRNTPGCILFVVDQSFSMNEPLGTESGVRKATFVADVLNKTLYELATTCTKNGIVHDYFDIGVIGYGGAGVGPAFAGPLAGQKLVKISQVGANPARFETRRKRESNGVGGVIEYDVKIPIWFEPTYSGGTPMYEAFSQAKTLLLTWAATHRESFPPVMLHVTDGDWNTSDPSSVADDILSLATNDGSALLFNLHLSAIDAEPCRYPTESDQLPNDKFAQALFRMSSSLTPMMINRARANDHLKHIVREGSRGYVFNAGIAEVDGFFDIGTRAINNSTNP